MADFNEAIRLDPNFSVAYANRGLLHLKEGHSDRAIADYDEAIRADAKNLIAYYNRGDAYRARGNNYRAIADFGEAIRLAPKFADARPRASLQRHARQGFGRCQRGERARSRGCV